MNKWMIKDWAGNDLTYHPGLFDSFEDAEEHLDDWLS